MFTTYTEVKYITTITQRLQGDKWKYISLSVFNYKLIGTLSLENRLSKNVFYKTNKLAKGIKME